MKLLPASPVAFRDPISKPPDGLNVSEVTGSQGNVMLAGTGDAIVFSSFGISRDLFEAGLRKKWGIIGFQTGSSFGDTLEDLGRYLEGEQTKIRAVVQPLGGTPFIHEVHRLLTRIPYGETLTYGEVAEALNHPGAARAVGSACGRNHAGVIVPCHRILAANGLGGYGGGLPIKIRLLGLEGIEW